MASKAFSSSSRTPSTASTSTTAPSGHPGQTLSWVGDDTPHSRRVSTHGLGGAAQAHQGSDSGVSEEPAGTGVSDIERLASSTAVASDVLGGLAGSLADVAMGPQALQAAAGCMCCLRVVYAGGPSLGGIWRGVPPGHPGLQSRGVCGAWCMGCPGTPLQGLVRWSRGSACPIVSSVCSW